MDIAQLAGIPTSTEVSLPDGSIPGDVFFRQWDADGPLVVDITCTGGSLLATERNPQRVVISEEFKIVIESRGMQIVRY